VSVFSFLRRGGDVKGSSADRAARWLRDKLEAEARAHFGWLDAGVWAGALHGVPRDTTQAARRLTSASVLGDEVLG
jgi:hypothetical protein